MHSDNAKVEVYECLKHIQINLHFHNKVEIESRREGSHFIPEYLRHYLTPTLLPLKCEIVSTIVFRAQVSRIEMPKV